ncbi:MAG: hypothetical protein KGD70_14515 [Candidatus Lokiarchaeota archaeon]|nr:hypothetical protein [Candidatus Lokiarchaeota archaeon]
MQKHKITKLRFRVFIFGLFLTSIISISGFTVYAMQSASIPLEIKEPLTITDNTTSLSLYAGETTNFEFTIENLASITHFQEFAVIKLHKLTRINAYMMLFRYNRVFVKNKN